MNIFSRSSISDVFSYFDFEKLKDQLTPLQQKIMIVALAVITCIGCMFLLYKRYGCQKLNQPKSVEEEKTKSSTGSGEIKSEDITSPKTEIITTPNPKETKLQDIALKTIVNDAPQQENNDSLKTKDIAPPVENIDDNPALQGQDEDPLEVEHENVTPLTQVADPAEKIDEVLKQRVIYQGINHRHDGAYYTFNEEKLLELKNKFDEFKKDRDIQKDFGNEDENLVYISSNVFNKEDTDKFSPANLHAFIRYLVLENIAFSYSKVPDKFGTFCIYLNQEAAQNSNQRNYDRQLMLEVDAYLQTLTYPVMEHITAEEEPTALKLIEELNLAHFRRKSDNHSNACSINMGYQEGKYNYLIVEQVMNKFVRNGAIHSWNFLAPPSVGYIFVKFGKDDPYVPIPNCQFPIGIWRDKTYVDYMEDALNQFDEENRGEAKKIIDQLRRAHFGGQTDVVLLNANYYQNLKDADIALRSRILDQLVLNGAIHSWNCLKDSHGKGMLIKIAENDSVNEWMKPKWTLWRDKAFIEFEKSHQNP